jgi:Ankyrin repeats (3 copies)/Ankyrin repeat
MPVKRLPPKPSLDHLKNQAKDLLKGHAHGDPGVIHRLKEFHPRFLNATDPEIAAASLKLSDALLAIARERGFPSWARLKAHIAKPTRANQLDLPHHERIEDPSFRRAVDLIDLGDATGLRAYLKQHPTLTRQHVTFEGGNYFRNPTLLEFIAENPVRHNALPANILQVAMTILDAGVEQAALNETLILVSTGTVARQCQVQVPLIDLLCAHGADPNAALQIAVVLGELAAANALIERGARINLPIAAGLGRMPDFMRLLPSSTDEDRHLALTIAADLGQPKIVKLLLESGVDPNRYNPVGGHSHTTPLHQAAGKGFQNIVQLFVEHGANLHMKDLHWNATPADWAKHAGEKEVEAYLREHETKKKQQ